MPDIQKFGEEIKNLKLFEYKNPPRLARDLLDEWPENMRLNAEMARKMLSEKNRAGLYRGVFKDCMAGIIEDVPTAYRSVDGWGIKQAITAEGQTAKREEEEKKGFLSNFGL